MRFILLLNLTSDALFLGSKSSDFANALFEHFVTSGMKPDNIEGADLFFLFSKKKLYEIVTIIGFAY